MIRSTPDDDGFHHFSDRVCDVAQTLEADRDRLAACLFDLSLRTQPPAEGSYLAEIATRARSVVAAIDALRATFDRPVQNWSQP